MQIAISSQNRKTITAHAGKCRNFWVYDIVQGRVSDKRLLVLPLEQTFHASHHDGAAPLDGINVLITGSLGNGLYRRLRERGIQSIVTAEDDPDSAVNAFLAGKLPTLSIAHDDTCHDHHH